MLLFAVNEFPVLKADAIKYVMIFRSQVRTAFLLNFLKNFKSSDEYVAALVVLFFQLPKEQLLQAVPLLISHLQAESTVEHTYAAHALERLFTMRGPNNTTL